MVPPMAGWLMVFSQMEPPCATIALRSGVAVGEGVCVAVGSTGGTVAVYSGATV